MATTNSRITDSIDWVGYVDWTVKDFHSFVTPRGATYNAFLIRDEQTALIDTVKGPYAETLLERVRALTPLDKVNYVVCNHAEPDHAGAIGAVVAACKNITVVCNAKCRDTLARYFDTTSWRFRIVSTGDTLSLGRHTLSFIDTPMIHWPESMATFVPEERILFSMDAFGQHIASSNRFDSASDLGYILHEAKAYYANILMPFGRGVLGLLDKVAPLNPRILATSHGVIWRSHVNTILEAYRTWAAFKPEAKVVVAYDTMWEATKQMAQAIADGASIPGVEVRLFAVRESGVTDIATEVLDAAVVAFGSPTLNMTAMPAMMGLLSYLKGLKPQGKVGLAFGAYGWSRGGAEAIDAALRDMKIEPLREPMRVAFQPTSAIIAECSAVGAMLAEKALAAASNQNSKVGSA